ncbi:MAG: hypothetical protein Q9159_001263 [Coniocarpon cinnabarinum]
MPSKWEHGPWKQKLSEGADSAIPLSPSSLRLNCPSRSETTSITTDISGSPTVTNGFHDREDRLRRLTVVYAPIFNNVFRARICGCRLAGDSSRFAPDIDIKWDTPCRLHFFDEVAVRFDIKLTKPDKGYDPETDPYFDRFGGHMAFALFMGGEILVQRSIDVAKLLPMGRLKEAEGALAQAWSNPQHRAALEEWRAEFIEGYFDWNSKYEEKGREQRRQMDNEDSKQVVKWRRGSF